MLWLDGSIVCEVMARAVPRPVRRPLTPLAGAVTPPRPDAHTRAQRPGGSDFTAKSKIFFFSFSGKRMAGSSRAHVVRSLT